MSLSSHAIDRLFNRLLASYGAQFTRLYDGLDVADVKTAWAHELSGFGDRLTDVAWALKNLPERCPNVIEFRNLCRRAPQAAKPALPEPKPDPARLHAELAKLQAIREDVAANAHGVDHKAWARRLLARHEAGERLRPIALRFAREALGRMATEA